MADNMNKTKENNTISICTNLVDLSIGAIADNFDKIENTCWILKINLESKYTQRSTSKTNLEAIKIDVVEAAIDRRLHHDSMFQKYVSLDAGQIEQ